MSSPELLGLYVLVCWPGSIDCNDYLYGHFGLEAQVNFVLEVCLQKPQKNRKIIFPRAGHFRYFLIFSILKNDFFPLFIMLITNFCTSPI